MAVITFTANDLREFQPDLAARLETEISEGAAEEPDQAEGPLECRVHERHAERAQVAVTIEGTGWRVSFAVSTPPVAGEVKMETRRALRDRTRRQPNYRRSSRR
jgi:hypothetical protein